MTTYFVLAATIGVVAWFGIVVTTASAKAKTVSNTTPQVNYPIGVINNSEPSGLAPPSATSFPGYVESYVNDFRGSRLPVGWETFSGVPGGDPGGQFAKSHVVVDRGMLLLNTWKDPKYHNKWVTGGLSQYAVSRVYGAYFVRSRITGLGPNSVELLWPADNSWPPEIDFNETGGGDAATSSTVHWSTLNHVEQRHIRIPMTQWHTWGVIWTPKSIIYTVDGKAWASITNAAAIPQIPMNLDFEQRAMCSLGFQCPTRPEAMQIDWVAEFAKRL